MHRKFLILHSFIDWNIFIFWNMLLCSPYSSEFWGEVSAAKQTRDAGGRSVPSPGIILLRVGRTPWRALPLFFSTSLILCIFSFLQLALFVPFGHLLTGGTSDFPAEVSPHGAGELWGGPQEGGAFRHTALDSLNSLTHATVMLPSALTLESFHSASGHGWWLGRDL